MTCVESRSFSFYNFPVYLLSDHMDQHIFLITQFSVGFFRCLRRFIWLNAPVFLAWLYERRLEWNDIQGHTLFIILFISFAKVH
jgi:hypothetical protein